MSASLTPISDLAYQTKFILNDANLEFAEFEANKIQVDSEKISNEKAELFVGNKFDQNYNAGSTDMAPKLAGPTASIDPETIQKLLGDLKNLGDEPELAAVLMSFVEKAVADYKKKGVEPSLADILTLFVAYASTVLTVKTPEIQQLFSDLMAVKNEDELVDVLKNYADSLLDDPTETPAKKSLLATLLSLLFLIIETQNLREESEAELSGMLVQLAFDQAEVDAQKTMKSSLYGLVGAGAAFGFTASVTGVSAGMQFKGYWDGRKLIDLQKEGKTLGKDTTSLNLKMHQESMRFNQRMPGDGTVTLRQKIIDDRQTLDLTITDRKRQLEGLTVKNSELQAQRDTLDKAKKKREKEITNATRLEERLPSEINGLGEELKTLGESKTRLKKEKLALPERNPDDVQTVSRDIEVRRQLTELGRINPAKMKEIQSVYDHEMKPAVQQAQARINKVEVAEAKADRAISDVKEQIRVKGNKKVELENQLAKAQSDKQRLIQERTDAKLEKQELKRKESLLEQEISSLNFEIEEWKGYKTQFKERHGEIVTSVERQEGYELELKTKQERIEALQLEIDDLSGSPDFYRNIGFAMSGMNNGSQIFENGFRFMGSKEDAEKIMAQARKDNFSQMGQARDQERTSGVAGLRTSIMNIVEALYRSDVETKAAVSQAIGR